MRSLIPLFTVLAAAAALAACDGGGPPQSGPTPTPSAKTSAAAATSAKPASAAKAFIDPEELKKLKALPARFDSEKNPTSEAKVKLGRTLYYDARLSKNHDVSCNSCHDLAAYGVDGKPTSPGHKGQLGNRNSPTVYNAGAKQLRIVDAINWQSGPLGGQAFIGYQTKKADADPTTEKNFAIGGRVSYGVSRNIKVYGDANYATLKPADGSETQRLNKQTLAVALAPNTDFWTRPELRLYVSRIGGNDPVKRAQFNGKSDAFLAGVQVEAWWE